MEQYKLPSYINPNKVFIVNRSELEGRIDPYFFKKEFDVISDKLSHIETLPLKKVSVKIFSGITPLSGGDSYTDRENGIAFIRSGDYSEDNIIDFSSTNYITIPVHNGVMSSSKIKKGDLLIAIVGATIGKVGIYNYDEEANINQAICAIRLKEQFIPEFIHIYLLTTLGQKILDRLKRPVARANINLEEISSIQIPQINLTIQKKIVNFYYNKINQKQQKEAEAKALLDSIDSYLLGELGITLPEKDNSLQKRVFTTRFSEITGGRLDSKGYDSDTVALKKAIINIPLDKYAIKPLKEFITLSVAGDWGIEDCDDYDSNLYERCLVIRATEYDNDYNLNLDNSRVKFRLIKKEKLKKIDIQENDLLIEKSGGSPDQPVGRIAILTKDIIANQNSCYSNFLHKIRVNDDINPSYLFSYLKTIHNIKLTESMQSQTNGIRNLIMSTYFNQFIVLPIKKGKIDIEKQNEIAGHIQSIRDRAKQLQNDAKTILEQAKQQVEQMILG